MTRGSRAHTKEIDSKMINENIQLYLKQTNCDHVFSFTIQNGIPVFKCENCSTEQIFTGDTQIKDVNSDMLLKAL